MTLLEGKPIAEEIKKTLRRDVAALGYVSRIAIVRVGEDSVSAVFVRLKEKFAREIGVEPHRYDIPADISTNGLRERMNDIVHEGYNKGILIQLPLPKQIDTQAILNTVVPEKDVDALSARSVGDFQVGKSKIMPPVIGAIAELFLHHHISLAGKKVVIIGYGRLVGQPACVWALGEHASVTVFPKTENFDPEIVKRADVIISGAGRAGIITGDIVKEGVIIVDVGTSEMNGQVVGDVEFDSVSKKAALITPVKGGVGPLTVAIVFRNLLTLAKAGK